MSRTLTKRGKRGHGATVRTSSLRNVRLVRDKICPIRKIVATHETPGTRIIISVVKRVMAIPEKLTSFPLLVDINTNVINTIRAIIESMLVIVERWTEVDKCRNSTSI